MEDPNTKFFSKDAWKGIAIAIIAVVIGQLVLAWQYYRLEEKRLPQIEQELAQQRESLERDKAREVLVTFFDAWQQGEEGLALRYLTENAVLQRDQEMFSLEQGFLSYEIEKLENVKNNEFRAQVSVITAQGLPAQIEVLHLFKILDTYYIDSLEIAG